MSKTWYPVIDYINCIECGSCVAKCPHNVYDIAKAPVPVVKNPELCIDHCHGCGNRCPVGAITYVGDNTGWTPPNGTKESEENCRSCKSGGIYAKKVSIELLYLDIRTCKRCIETDAFLDEVVAVLAPALRLAGYDVDYQKTEITTKELAEQHRLLSSPTIRVNGRDICGYVAENSCSCCGNISETETDCRVFVYNGKTYEAPPKEMLAEEILKAVFNRTECECSNEGYVLPENLSRFFHGKENRKYALGGDCKCR